MARSGEVLDVPALGYRMEYLRTAAETGGELVEVDVVGRPRGLVAQPHVHSGQTERHEVIEGAMRLRIGRTEHVLHPGDAMEVPPGTSHTQRPAGEGPLRVRITLRPARRTEGFFERLAVLSAGGGFLPGGFPRPVAAAELVRDFGDDGHAAFPPVPVQRALARAILWVDGRRRPGDRARRRGRTPA